MKKFLTVLFAVASLLIMTGCADSPKDVTKKWMQAINVGDVVKANEYSSNNFKELNALIISGYLINPDAKNVLKTHLDNIDSARVEIKGDDAVVYVGNANFQLKKIDGKWKMHVED